MPQKLPKKLARQLAKQTLIQEKREEDSQATSQTQSTPVSQMARIPEMSFRTYDPQYKPFADTFKSRLYQQHPEQAVEADPYTSGYCNCIPLAPGTAIELSSPDYPILNGKEVRKASLQRVNMPIIVLRDEKDLDNLIAQRIMKERAEVRQTARELMEKERAIWILPDGRSITCGRDAKTLSEAIASIIRERENEKKVDLYDQKPAKKMTEEEFYKKIKLVFYWVISGVVLFLAIYFTLQHFFWGQTIGGKPVKAYWKRLGLSPGASADEIKKAYRKQAMKLHPDRNPNCQDCEQRFAKIADAYKYLLSQAEGTDEVQIPTILDDDMDFLAWGKRLKEQKQ